MKGWILLHRKLTDHWLWQDDKNFHRWVTILFYVNHSPAKFLVGNELEICEPGASYRSLEEWARLLKTNKKQVKIFFELLEKEDMIKCQILGKGNRRKHLLTVVNWNKYQNIGTEEGTEKAPEKEPKKLPKKYPEQRKSKKGINKDFIPPTLEEVISFFTDSQYSAELAERAFKHYDLANWKDSEGKQVLNWKQKMHTVWFKPENKPKNGYDHAKKQEPQRTIKKLNEQPIE